MTCLTQENLRAAFCIVLSHGRGVSDHLGAAVSGFAIHDVPYSGWLL